MRTKPASIGRYHLIESIGAGGMAEVFRARGTGLGRAEREVAIKMVHAHLAGRQEMVELFHREAQVASTLAHPNLVTVLESGVQDGCCYLVMEYVDGVDLRGLLRRVWGMRRPVPVGVAVAIASAICAGLHHAHERRDEHGELLEIVHRDVSPSNVLLSRDGAVKVSDFGVAKATAGWSAVHSAHGTIRGKLAYMAPEQARGDEIDRRADVFAVGSVLFEMLAGHRPVQGEGEVEMLHDLVYGSVPQVRRSRSDCPESIAEIVTRALERDVERRWPTARAMQQALERSALAEGYFVTPSALARFIDEITTGAPTMVAVDATTRVRDAVPTQDAAPPSVVVQEPTETIGEEPSWVAVEPAAPAPAPTSTPRWPWVAASLVGVVGLGAVGWWVQGQSPSAADAAPAATVVRPVVEPGSAVEPARMQPGPVAGRTVDPSPAPPEPEPSEPAREPREADEVEPDAVEPDAVEPDAVEPDPTPAVARRRRPRGRTKKRSSKTKAPGSTIAPSETLFPVNE